MSRQYRRFVAVAATVLILVPVLAFAVETLFDLSSPTSAPFPSDRFTVDDHEQQTGLRVSLPKPHCGVRPSDCAATAATTPLHASNPQPRLPIPVPAPIPASPVTRHPV